MKELEVIRGVIGKLSMNEKKEIQARLKLFNENTNSVASPSLKLFNLLLNNSDFTSAEIQFELYKGQNLSAFKKLISRVLERIYDVLIIKISLDQNEIYDRRTQDIFLLERQLLLTEILRFRGLFNLACVKLDRVIFQCKYYEHYDILIYALEKKRTWSFNELVFKKNLELESELVFYNEAKNLQKLTSEIYFSILVVDIENVTYSKLRFLKLGLANVRKRNLKIKSNSIQYNVYFMMIKLYSLEFKYNRAIVYFDKLLELLKLNSNIYSRYKQGSVLLNKGVYLRFDFNFDLSIENISNSKKYFSDLPENNIIHYEQMFLSNFYKGDVSKSRYYLKNLESECKLHNNSKLKFEKLTLYQSVFQLIENNRKVDLTYFSSIKQNTNSFLSNLESKIIVIISFLELEKYDVADSNISNLKKYFSRLNKTGDIYFQYELIIKVLVKLSFNSYDFEKTQNQVKYILIQLKEISKRFRFPYYEMIIFHEWFTSKVKNVPYNHTEVMQRLKKLNRPRS